MTKTTEPEEIDFVPDWDTPCDICEQTPTVTGVNKEGKQTNHWEMCGPCTWGEADTLDPDNW